EATKLMAAVEICEGLVIALVNCCMDTNALNHLYFEKMCQKFPFNIIEAFTQRTPHCYDVSQLLAHVRKRALASVEASEYMGLSYSQRQSARVNMTSAEPSSFGRSTSREQRGNAVSCKLC